MLATIRCFIFCIMLVLSNARFTTNDPLKEASERQLPLTSAAPLINTVTGSFPSFLISILPALVPLIALLGLGLLLLPLIGLLLFDGNRWGHGGFFNDFFGGKRRSLGGLEKHPLFSKEKLLELIANVTTAIEKRSHEN